MKKALLPMLALCTLSLWSCKGKGKNSSDNDNAKSNTATSDAPAASPGEPKSYTLTFTPDTVILGKAKEVFVKIRNGKGIELQDPDGKDEGIQITFDLDVTNKNKVGGNSLFFRTDNFRLLLDNGNSITESKGGAETVEAESTKQYKEITYKVPAGSKPKTLNLFHDETRVSVSVDIK